MQFVDLMLAVNFIWCSEIRMGAIRKVSYTQRREPTIRRNLSVRFVLAAVGRTFGQDALRIASVFVLAFFRMYLSVLCCVKVPIVRVFRIEPNMYVCVGILNRMSFGSAAASEQYVRLCGHPFRCSAHEIPIIIVVDVACLAQKCYYYI